MNRFSSVLALAIISIMTIAAPAEILIFSTQTQTAEDTEFGTPNGLSYLANIRARQDAGENLDNRVPTIDDITSVRGHDWEFGTTQAFIHTGGNNVRFRFTPSDSTPDRPRLRGMSLEAIVYRDAERTDPILPQQDEWHDLMVDIWVNRVPRIWGHAFVPYRVFETDPDKGLFSVGIEVLGDYGAVDIILFDYYTTDTTIQNPEPGSLALLGLMSGGLLLRRRSA